MTATHIISTLVKRRAELTGEIEHTQHRTRQMLADLDGLDATIRLFDPDYRVEAIKPKAFRPPNDWANRGEMSRVILDILRQRETRTSADTSETIRRMELTRQAICASQSPTLLQSESQQRSAPLSVLV
jgi:hypothetical protein